MSVAQSNLVSQLVWVILTAYLLYLRPWRRGRGGQRDTRFDRFALLALDLLVFAFLVVFVVAFVVFGAGAILWPTADGQRPASAQDYFSLGLLILFLAILGIRALQRWVRRPASRQQD